MPRLNSRGQALLGVGSGPASVDGRVIISPGGGPASWFDDDHIVVNSNALGPWQLLKVNVADPSQVAVLGVGDNEIAAGGGQWLAWRPDIGLTGSLPNLPAGGDVRGAGLNGTLAYCPNRGSGYGLVLQTGASQFPIPGAAVLDEYALQVLGPESAIWYDGIAVRSIGCPMPRPAVASGKIRRVDLGSEVWLVYYAPDLGLVAHVDGAKDGYVLESRPIAFNHDAVAVNGELVVAWSTSQGEGPGDCVNRPVDRSQPRQALVPVAQPTPVPHVGRPLWLGFFVFPYKPGQVAGKVLEPFNCILPVDNKMQVVDADTGRPFLQYVAGNPEGDPAATAAAVKAGKASGLPVLVYWPRPQPSVWIPQADVIGIEAYQLAGESAAAFKNRIGAACKAVGRAVLIAQAYTSNTSNASNLEPLAALYGQLAIEHSNVEGILAFSAGGRATGWDDHPEIWAGWQALFAGITAPHLAPVVTPQPKPTPKPTPTPAPIPVPPQELPDMNLPARCYVLLHNSNIAACAPGQAAVDLNHSPQEYGAWQEVEIVKSKEWAADNPRVIVRFVSANRILRVDKVAAGLRKYDQCVQTWSPDASDADSSWQQGIAAGPFIHYTSDSTDGSRHGVVYTVTCVDGSGKLFR